MFEENKELKIGDKMGDGTIYAGISPVTNKPMYAMPQDAGFIMSEIVQDVMLEDDDEREPSDGMTADFNQAAKYAKSLNMIRAYGHNDWRLPTKEELNVLHQNKDEGSLKGTFNDGAKNSRVHEDSAFLYWSSTPSPDNSDDNEYQYACVKDFSGKPVQFNCTVHNASVRLVRG